MATSSPTKFASSVPLGDYARVQSSKVPVFQQLSAIDGGRKAEADRNTALQFVHGVAADVSRPTVEISPPSIVTRRTMAWHGMAAESVQFTGPDTVSCRFRAPMHLLIAYEQGERIGGETFVEGLPQSTLRSFARKLTFVPAGHVYRERHEPGALTRVTFFYFDPSRLAGAGAEDFSLAPRLFFEDLAIWHMAVKLNTFLKNTSSGDRLYLKALAVVLMHDLVRLNRGGSAVQLQVRGGLASWQQRTAAAYITEHLAERISLATLAQLVRLSPHHFCRAFKQSFGVPPHRFQNDRRIERAKLLLAKPAYSMTDIALEMGFGSSSSFATAFRKATGLTPTTYSRCYCC